LLPRLKPFDLSIRLDHSLDISQWRVPYTQIGFDVTLVHSTNPSCSTPSEAAQYNESDLCLRDGEKLKFARRTGGTNPITSRGSSPKSAKFSNVMYGHKKSLGLLQLLT
jgi:hypothetical protein